MFGLMKKNLSGSTIAHGQEIGGMWSGEAANLTVGLACGLVAGTRVATAMGWRPVQAIAEGDLVLTFDRGLEPVRNMVRGTNWERCSPCPDSMRPLHVPIGALGNQQEMTILPEQSVMVESDTADELFGDPFALIAGAELGGFRGIERVCPETELEVIQLHFDADEIVFANLGALAFCPSAWMLGIDTILSECDEEPSRYRNLPHDEAAMLIECLAEEDAGAEIACPAPAMTYAAAFA